jgi:hypothetical protein
MTPLKGTVEVQFTVTHRLALSLATKGWTEEECAALVAGDHEAREELTTAVWTHGTRNGFDDIDEDVIDLRISDPVAQEEAGR